MNIESIECAWIDMPPDLFSREVIVTIASSKVVSTRVLGMGGVDGKPGPAIGLATSELDGEGLYKTIKDSYAFRDLGRVRFSGPLTSRSWRLIRDFSLVVLDHEDDQIVVAVEFPVPGSETLPTLNQILNEKNQLIDDVCLVVKIPTGSSDKFAKTTQATIDALMGCIVALRNQNLRTLSLFLLVDDSSSPDVAREFIDSIKDVCMEDDTVELGKGLALGSFIIAIIPSSGGDALNAIASGTREQLKDDLFDDSRVVILRPSPRLFESLGI
jgi:hypothetical protein